jgi:ribosomal protein L37AE/L43A
MSEPTTVYWHNGACYSCGSRTMRRNVRQSWCAGCGVEVGGWGYGPDDRADTPPPDTGAPDATT